MGLQLSCSHPQHEKKDETIAREQVQVVNPPKVIVTDSTFLALFPAISEEVLHVFSPNERTGGNKFMGTPIPKEFDRYFFFDNYFKRDPGDIYTNIHSCYQFKLSNDKTGLLVRSPGMYAETAIDLLIWDNRKNSIIGHFKLADEAGDAGWNFVKDAWVTDLNKDNRLDILTRRKDRWQKDMDGMDGKERNMDSVEVYIENRGDFRKTEFPIDTARFQLLDWVN